MAASGSEFASKAAVPRIDGHTHLWSDDPRGAYPYGRTRYEGDPLAAPAEYGDEMADLAAGSEMARYATQGTEASPRCGSRGTCGRGRGGWASATR
jgi:hypothetical protein